MTLADFFPEYVSIKNKNFSNSVFHKKEFQLQGDEFEHQEFISRFLSYETLYDSLLIFHEMGTGKTCSAFKTIEKQKSKFKGIIFVTKPTLIESVLIPQLTTKCFEQNIYEPDMTNLELDVDKSHIYKLRQRNLINEFYTFRSHLKFAKELETLSDKSIVQNYSNKIIVIDEIHNVRNLEKEKGTDVYKQIHRLFHLAKNCKKILMSGTPMVDSPKEIASTLNLLLPLNQQIDEKTFDNTFFNNPNSVNKLKPFFKGYISYLKFPENKNLKIINEGKILPPLQYFHVVPSIMSPSQTAVYTKAYEEDSESSAVAHLLSQQSSLFVYNKDNTYGQTFYEKYLPGGKLSREFNLFYNKRTDQEKLDALKDCSSIYTETIKDILSNPDKKFWIFNRWVTNSGSILFSKILESFGFTKYKIADKLRYRDKKLLNIDKIKRYIILTGETDKTALQNFINDFNDPVNKNGEFIQVVIGSEVVSEGITLKNIQRIHIQTPDWNNALISQAISRGIRIGSHEGMTNPEVHIFKHVALAYNDITPSINMQMYKETETKDLKIKAVERVIMETAVDCALFYKKNKRTDENERDCEYTDCDYVCDDVDMQEVENGLQLKDLDTSTYELFYSYFDIEKIMDKIKGMFKVNFKMEWKDIYARLKNNYTEFEILTALEKVIYENHPLTNAYGFTSYLKENENLFYLSDDPTNHDSRLSNLYAKTPVLTMKENDTKTIIYELSSRDLDQAFIPDDFKEQLFETAYKAEKQGIQMNNNGKKALSLFEMREGNTYGSGLRCFNEVENEWENCPEKEKQKRPLNLDLAKQIGYTGLLKKGKFALKKYLEPQELQKLKKKEQPSGRVCETSWVRKELENTEFYQNNIDPNFDLCEQLQTYFEKNNLIEE